jgi:hypothetical protein
MRRQQVERRRRRRRRIRRTSRRATRGTITKRRTRTRTGRTRTRTGRTREEQVRWLLLALAVLATHRNANACARSSCAELSIINAAIFGMTSAFASCRTKSSEQKENGSRWQVCHMRFLD